MYACRISECSSILIFLLFYLCAGDSQRLSIVFDDYPGIYKCTCSCTCMCKSVNAAKMSHC